MEDAEVVLRRAPLFEGLDEESARALRRQMADVKLSRGEHLFLEGQEGDRLYVVLDGKIKLTRAATDGRENLISVLGPGEMFGELSLFDPRPRTSSASAVTDALLASLKHEALIPLLSERPDVSMHMLRALAQRLLFQSTAFGDLTPHISLYFDTRVGAKGDADSYRRIACSFACRPEQFLFITDAVRELEAASSAGMHVLRCQREGPAIAKSSDDAVIHDFRGVFPS